MASTCLLCKEKSADKKNTHYLTDAIIRTCLNMDGTKEREQGLYFDISTNKESVEFNAMFVYIVAREFSTMCYTSNYYRK
mgnify:CR=1 FL=1